LILIWSPVSDAKIMALWNRPPKNKIISHPWEYIFSFTNVMSVTLYLSLCT
jgi:hypothetical protein